MELRSIDEARFLAQSGYQCFLAISRFRGRDTWLNQILKDTPSFTRFEFEPPPFFEEWNWRRRNLLISRLFWLYRLRYAKIDLAHIFYAWTQEGGSRLWLCHQAGIPCVLSIHNAFPLTSFSSWHRRLSDESFASVRGLYAVSQSALDHFVAIYGSWIRDQTILEVIPNFVDVSRFVPSSIIRQETRKILNIPLDAKVVGSIGRMDTQKQPFHVLNVFDQLWTRRQDLFLIFCGQGPMEEAVRAAVASKPWGNRVRFLGFRADVERIFPALDVHLLLSKQEGFGITTVEAMACGVPVVATDVPGSRDILADSDAGCLVPFGDHEAAATRVASFLDTPSRTELACRIGRQTAVAYYTKEIWRQRLTDFYEKVFSISNAR